MEIQNEKRIDSVKEVTMYWSYAVLNKSVLIITDTGHNVTANTRCN